MTFTSSLLTSSFLVFPRRTPDSTPPSTRVKQANVFFYLLFAQRTESDNSDKQFIRQHRQEIDDDDDLLDTTNEKTCQGEDCQRRQ